MTEETEADPSDAIARAIAEATEAVKVALGVHEKLAELAGDLTTTIDRAHAALERDAVDDARKILEPFALACPAAPSPLPSAI